MSVAQNHILYERVSRKGFRPAHVAEVGVHEPESSNIYRFIQEGIRATLVEPEPDAVEHIQQHFGAMDHVTLHVCAACDFDGEVELVRSGPSTFVGDLPSSPAMVNDGLVPGESERFTAKAVLFSAMDDGSIDLLSIDTEGSEWYVIKHLVSRPTVISIETHGALYLNPYLAEIEGWMRAAGYQTWYKTKTDTVYVCGDAVKPSMGERVVLAMKTLGIALRRARKKLTKGSGR